VAASKAIHLALIERLTDIGRELLRGIHTKKNIPEYLLKENQSIEKIDEKRLEIFINISDFY